MDSVKFREMDILIEEFYDGHELDINILVQKNKTVFIGISDNFKPSEPYFFEADSTTPSVVLSPNEISLIEKICADWIPKLNIQNALLHFEAFCRPISLYPNREYDVRKPFENIQEFFMPIEMNLRGGGGETWSMNLAAYGVNLNSLYIDLMIGVELDQEALSLKQNNPKHGCISMIYSPQNERCRISEIQVDMAKIIETNNIVEIGVLSPVDFICLNDEYVGWMTIQGEFGTSHEELLKLREQYAKCVNYKFVKEAPEEETPKVPGESN
jgi:hypothetical protein